MSRVGCRSRRWVALRPGVLGLLIFPPTRAVAQDPVMIPGLSGASLQAAAKPLPTAWPSSGDTDVS
jgi:porin